MRDISLNVTAEKDAKCPQCGEFMANMGLDFASPKKDNIKEWNHIKNLYSVSITFHSCGCTGPGYIPTNKESLIAYFKEIITNYNHQLVFWRNRIEPKTEKEIQRENSKHWDKIIEVSLDQQSKKTAIKNEEAIKYWLDRIQEVELKIKTLHDNGAQT
jgi:hypothetical protein